MQVTQTIRLSDEERLAIQEVLSLCDEIADIAHCSVMNVFEYMADVAEIVGGYKYSIRDTLYIAEIG